MEKGVRISYYKESDELNIHLGEPREAVLFEIDDEIYIRLDPRTNKILGFTILNFEERTDKKGYNIPILAHFSLPQKQKKSIVMR